jgi:hypothetical protein
MSRKSHVGHDDHEEGHSEAWLVSYSDMMTLLFGLFVMLYSMAMETQGKIDDRLKEVTNSIVTETEIEQDKKLQTAQQSIDLEKKAAESVEKVTAETAKKIQDELERQQTENQVLKERLAKLDAENQIREQKKITENELEREIASIKSETEKQLVLKNLELEEIKLKNSDQQKQLSSSVSQIENLQVQLKELQKEKLKNDKKISRNELVEKEEVQREKENLEKTRDLQARIREEKKRADEFEQKISLREKETIELRSKLAALEKQEADSPKFLMFVLKWFTDRHDLDMTLVDPKGRKYDFKKREYSGHPGKFTLDSRSGPGAEIWQTAQFIPGEYKVAVSFYQEYGNKSHAKFIIEVSSPKSVHETKQLEMSFSQKVKELRFRVDSNGAITSI